MITIYRLKACAGGARAQRVYLWPPWWLAPRRIIGLLKRRYRVMHVAHGIVDFYVLDPTEEECLEIVALDANMLERATGLIRGLFDSEIGSNRIRIVCIGSRASMQRLPRIIRRHIAYGWEHWGCWDEITQCAYVRWHPSLPIAEVIVHELVHGIMDRHSGGFPYPSAVQEGWAQLATLAAIQNTTLIADQAHHLFRLCQQLAWAKLEAGEPCPCKGIVEMLKVRTDTLTAWTMRQQYAFHGASLCLILLWVKSLKKEQPLDSLLSRFHQAGYRVDAQAEWISASCALSVAEFDERLRCIITQR